MSEQVDPAPLAATGPAPPERGDVTGGALARLFAAHAAQVFDYCRSLTGSDAAAADATTAALGCAQHQPRTPHLLRARLLAIARREVLAETLAGDRLPADFAVGGTEAPDLAVTTVLGRIPAPCREMLALVYRHGIWPEQLPEVLGVSGREAYERLAAAEHEFVRVAAAGEAADTPTVAPPALEDMTAIPLVTLPGSVWPKTVAKLTAQTARLAQLPAVTDPPARPRPRLRLWLRLAAAAALPVTAIGWALADSGGPAQPSSDRGAAGPAVAPLRLASRPPGATPGVQVSRPPTRGAGSAGQRTAPAQQRSAPIVPIIALLPSASNGIVLPVATPAASLGTARPAPQTSVPVSVAPDPSATPSPATSPVTPSPAVSAPASLAPSPSPAPASASPAPTG